MIHSAARMYDDASAFRQGDRGVVKIAACTSAVLQFLAQDIQRCNLLHPGVRIDLQELNSHGVMQTLSRSVVDIGIDEASLGRPDFPTQTYREDRLVVLTPVDHPLAELKRVTVRDLFAYDVIGLTEGSAISTALSRLASQIDRVLHMRNRVGSFDSMTAMVAAGVGIGVMPLDVARLLASGEHFRLLGKRSISSIRGRTPCLSGTGQ
jgi:DNA-binding transcriptional LysR family regulator